MKNLCDTLLTQFIFSETIEKDAQKKSKNKRLRYKIICNIFIYKVANSLFFFSALPSYHPYAFFSTHLHVNLFFYIALYFQVAVKKVIFII